MTAITSSFTIGSSYKSSMGVYTVIKRTPTRINVVGEDGQKVSKKVFVSYGVEYIKPLGSYSKATVLYADNEVKEVKNDNEVFVSYNFESMINVTGAADDFEEEHDIDSVYVEMSESMAFDSNVTYTYEEFNKRCEKALAEVLQWPEEYRGAYLKTYITVNFKDGESYKFRLDINESERNIADAFNSRLKYYLVNSEKAKSDAENKIALFWETFTYKF